MKSRKIIKILWNILVGFLTFLLILLSFSLSWAKKSFGNIGFEEIVFHLNVPLEGAAQDVIFSYIKTALLPSVLLFAVFLLLVLLRTKYSYELVGKIGKKTFKWQLFPIRFYVLPVLFVGAFWVTALVQNADTAFGFKGYVKNQLEQSQIIREEYIPPAQVEVSFPEKKRNLIWIYMESAETSAQDIENGGFFAENYIPEMTEIAKNNISFSRSEKVEGASVVPGNGWTIGALVGETAGLPLKIAVKANSMDQYEYFLPGAVSLGEILEDNGYRNIFMAGSDFTYGGRTNYFTQHGNYEIWDYYTAIEEKKIPEDYYVWWGFEDQKLYAYAKEKLLETAKQDEPFNFSMLTVDTHHQDGYVCELCQNDYEGRYENVWRCASRQLNEFLEWLKQQDFYENTTVVITGDHCSMDSDFYEGVVTDKKQRKIYNAFINTPTVPKQEKNRLFNTMDFFPTVLASLGATIDGERLGLGTNLFSDEKTLSEKYGEEYLYNEVYKNSQFYNREILFPK